MNKHIIPILVVVLLITSSFVGVSNQTEEITVDKETMDQDYAFYHLDKHYLPEGYSYGEKRILRIHADDAISELSTISEETTITSLIESIKKEKTSPTLEVGGPMDSPWPMHGYDVCHTGMSPYSTADNPGVEKWRFKCDWSIDGSAVIDENGTIYFGSHKGDFYALYPNGTQKWKLMLNWNLGIFGISPAIDENGVIYVGNTIISAGLYAINPNGTLKWKYNTGNIETSPVIGDDGTIYFGAGAYVRALYPNGTLKWAYHTEDVVQSSPAIGEDGIVYCGSHDSYLYALYPDNGTLKWRFKTGGWVHGAPTVGPDGTVYIGSDDTYLYAFYPNNGTMKWKCKVGSMRSSPSIDKDGVLYFGVWEYKIRAVYPNGTIKWSFDPGNRSGVWGSTAAISADGTIYIGTCIDIGYMGGGEIIALNSDGMVKWRKIISSSIVTSSPCISEDGTIYIGSSSGYLHAFGRGPLIADAGGPYEGNAEEEIQFTGTVFGGYPPYTYHWNFGDGNNSYEQNPTHAYSIPGNYIATFTVTDSEDNSSSDNATVTVDIALPTVRITKPENALYLLNIKLLPLSKPLIIGKITIEVEASQEEVGIERVDFYIDLELKQTDTEAPYSWIWRLGGFIKHRHTIKVVAFDKAGNHRSDVITVWKFF